MIIRYLGHSFFTFTAADGTLVAADPYGSLYQYPERQVPAQICTISHHHFDHDGISSLTGKPQIVDTEGVTQTEAGVRLLGVPTWHDEKNGALRGPNIFYVMEMDGLRIGHAGDLGHLPDKRQVAMIGKLDVLLLPVGGVYTIDAKAALEVRALLCPKVTIPMHYRTRYSEETDFAPLSNFLSLAGESPTPAPFLRITKEDVSQRNAIEVLEIQA